MPKSKSVSSGPKWLRRVWTKTSSNQAVNGANDEPPSNVGPDNSTGSTKPSISRPLLDIDIPQTGAIDLFSSKRAAELEVETAKQHPTAERVEQFVHLPLRSPREIRLLQVSSNRQRATLHGNFVHVSLDDPGLKFQAISYCWGDSKASERFWCSPTRCLLITSSLHSILKLLATEATQSYFWIDALCINQSSKTEKGHQIRLMRDIFASAQQVNAFIGESSSDSDLAMRFIETLRKSISSMNLMQGCGLLREINESLEPDMQTLGQMDFTRYPSPYWTALKALLLRPWFQRSWCIQEVVVAKEIILRCGTQSAKWEDLAFAMALLAPSGLAQLSRSDENGYLQFEGCLNLRATFVLRGSRDNRNAMHLQHCLLLGNEFSATLPQDKIFSMLGIAGDAADKTLDPDYSISAQALYIRVTGYLYERDRCLYLLHLAGIGYRRKLPDLPSWVPDFSVRRRSTILGAVDRYRASNLVTPIIEINEANQLKLQWMCLDYVVEVIRPMPELRRSSDRQESKQSRVDLIEWFDETAQWIKSLAPYPTDEECDVVYWRTLLCDMSFASGFASKKPMYVEYPERFGAMLQILRWSVELSMPPDVEDATMFILLEEQELLIKIIMEARDRRLFRTERGYVGLGPAGSSVGDIVCTVSGTITPFLLRRRDQVEVHDLVGECYIDGIMKGEGHKFGMTRTILLA